jgi:DNA (cytosine-5)-methyltransferase 1
MLQTTMCGTDRNDDDDNEVELEDVLVVPQRLTKSGYEMLTRCHANPRPYYLEGRFGSRTHRINETTMALPIISRTRLKSQAQIYPELQNLLDTPGVSVVTKPFVASNRARDVPQVDARMHPEREQPKKIKTTNGSVTPVTATNNNHNGNKSKIPLFTYAELFAGIGGFGVALDALGGKCVFCSELEDHCRALYQHNFETTPTNVIHGDIYQVPDSDFPSSVDLLVGGFPCQPFSALGKQPGLECEKGHLFLQIVRFLQISRPKSFLLENVPGLQSMNETYQTVLSAFEDAGYHVTTEICSSRGVTAQNRKRLFFVGLRKDMDATPLFEFPFVPDLKLRAHNVLDYDELPDDELQILRLADTTLEQLLNNGRNWRPKSMFWPNRVSDTMTSHYGNAVGRGESQLVPCKAPHNPRRFSMRECARLMGFPNSYQFLPPAEIQGDMAYRKQYYRMFGNAVCPPLIAALAGAVLDCCHLSVQDDDGTIDWVRKGHDTAIQLAMAATRPSGPVRLPVGCLIPTPPKNKKDDDLQSKGEETTTACDDTVVVVVEGGEKHHGKRRKTDN